MIRWRLFHSLNDQTKMCKFCDNRFVTCWRWKLFFVPHVEDLKISKISKILRFFTALEKREFRSSGLSLSSLIISLSSTSVILWIGFDLSKSNCFNFDKTFFVITISQLCSFLCARDNSLLKNDILPRMYNFLLVPFSQLYWYKFGEIFQDHYC